MTSLPNFSPYGYQVTEQLNDNFQSGRITYKALEIATRKLILIKQFRFATSSNWDSYKQIEREIEVLQSLNHTGIPRYLAKFDPGDGLCLVQEYKEAEPLSKSHSFDPEAIRSIAYQLLEILVYLQGERVPPIFHRDIKPENVLFDNNLKVYLIDFGFARIGNNTMAMSSIMGGTPGFMPPEQFNNQKLTEASDLYGLGATLICLITHIKSADIGSLVDFSSNKIIFKDRVPQFSLRFLEWLEKMVEPNPANRYQNAKLALEALKPLYLMRVPEVTIDKSELNFVADFLKQKLSQTITINNNIPDTVLQGKLSISPHPSDPPHTPESHSWIWFSPGEFKRNHVNCVVTVDTSKLRANKNYEREICLSSNAGQEKYYLKIKLKTAPIQLNVALPPYWLIVSYVLFLAIIVNILVEVYLWKTYSRSSMMIFEQLIGLGFFGAIGGVIGSAVGWRIVKAIGGPIFGAIGGAILGVIVGAIFGGGFSIGIGGLVGLAISVAIVGLAIGAENSKKIGLEIERVIKSGTDRTIIGAIFGAAIFGAIFQRQLLAGAIGGVILGAIIWAIVAAIIWSIHWGIHKLQIDFYNRGFKKRAIALYVILMIITGSLIGLGTAIGFNFYLLAGFIASSVPLAAISIYPALKLAQLKAQYRRQESQNLIDP